MTITPEPISIAFIGAGNITFGNDNVLWNHSSRLEHLLGDRLSVSAIIDPNPARVESVLAQKRASPPAVANAYADTKYFSSVTPEALDYLKQAKLDLIIIGAPPAYRGTTITGRNLELLLIDGYGSTPIPPLFIEKPVATTRPDEPLEVAVRIGKAPQHVTTGMGYMFRYLKVVQKLVSIIRENNLTVMSIVARYANAYARVRKPEWWSKREQGGPIIEQATHFCDLMRYIAGVEVDLNSVKATALEYYEPAGKLSHQCIDESALIPEEERIPRCTSAFWKFENGAIGTLIHIVALHGIRFSNEIAVYADGYQLRLCELYTNPTLYVRSPESDTTEKVYNYPDDDPFFNEMETFVSVSAKMSGKQPLATATAESSSPDVPPPSPNILTSYEDACQTFALTWKIRDESEIKSNSGKSA
ncbi:putative oxidoreductase C terminal-domain-containing protein [Lipomyces oligophaga]|uniref:putative oxidoreductase C terminal-domain-containing protein n=1 Tax=Lipomyces oligophaga TaxID=45792 RepID=UPI0034CFD97D